MGCRNIGLSEYWEVLLAPVTTKVPLVVHICLSSCYPIQLMYILYLLDDKGNQSIHFECAKLPFLKIVHMWEHWGVGTIGCRNNGLSYQWGCLNSGATPFMYSISMVSDQMEILQDQVNNITKTGMENCLQSAVTGIACIAMGQQHTQFLEVIRVIDCMM